LSEAGLWPNLGKSSSGILPFSVSHLLVLGQSLKAIFWNYWVGKNAVADFEIFLLVPEKRR
jgi:hypothetical protein